MTYVWKGKQQQRASTKGIDGPDGGPGKGKVDEAKAKRCQQGVEVVCACVFEDGARVKGDNVDAAHLLGDHHDKDSARGATDARDAKQVDEAGDVVGLADDGRFDGELGVDVVDVAGGLDRVVAQAQQRAHRVAVPVLLDVPARRLWAEVDKQQQGHGGDEGTGELVAPRGHGDAEQHEVGAGAEQDAERDVEFWSPQLSAESCKGEVRILLSC